jgi:prolyl-tRNA editing enzyme YbaK/EbsC (Cys-tRNA(Pro) deacylase)
VKKADAEAVRRHTGFAIGGVPPVGFTSPIPTFFDRDLLTHPVVWAAAGTPHHVFPIAPSALLRLTGAAIVDLKARAL